MDLLDRMSTFVRIVDARSLSAAARARGQSLSAVSRQLDALEAELGVQLIARTTRRLHVTEAGRRFYEHCARVLRDVEDARADMAGPAEVRGSLTVSAPITMGMHHVVPRLSAVVERHPGLALELRLEDRVVDLIADGVDIAVRAGVAPPDSATVCSHPLLTFERVLVASPAYLRRRGALRHPADLARHDALVQRGSTGAAPSWQLVSGEERYEVTVRGALSCQAPLVLRQWAAEGAGVAFLPSWLVEDDIAAGRLRRALPDWSSSPIHAWAIYRVDLRRSPSVRALLEGLAEGR